MSNSTAAGEKSRFTKLERSWIIYDVGNSAFTMMVSTLIPIWFNSLAGQAGMSPVDYLAAWSFATSIATVIMAFLGPVLGTIADYKGFKKTLFTVFLVIGVLSCASLGFAGSWMSYIILYVVAKVTYQSTLVIYDSMLVDVTPPERMDFVSSNGFAWGYLGSCVPFIAALALYLAGMKNLLDLRLAVTLGFMIVAAWWFAITIPLLHGYKQKHFVLRSGENGAGLVFSRLGKTLMRLVKKDRRILVFLFSVFLYIDGVYTIIDEAVAIGSALGLNQTGLLVVLLLTQVVAFLFAVLFGKLSEKYRTADLISVSICGYFAVAVFALFMHSLWQFGIMAFVVGMFQGAIQALSRSYYAKIIPPDTSGEYFGLYDIIGKGAAFVGTMLIGVTTKLTGSVNIGVGTLAVLFLGGLLLLRSADRMGHAD